MNLTRRELAVGAAGLFAARTATAADATETTELWTWAPRAQLPRLEKRGFLVGPTDRPALGKQQAFDLLKTWPEDPTAQLLGSERFEQGRFTWMNPWAMCLGADGADKPELIRVQLARGAELAQVSTTGGPPSPPADAARLAGFVFESASDSCTETAWRAVYLGDEQQVTAWQRRTRQISARLERDIGYLSRLSRELRDVPDTCAWIASVKQAWRGEGTGALFEYARGLAFATPEYRPTPENLRRIITTLQSRLAV